MFPRFEIFFEGQQAMRLTQFRQLARVASAVGAGSMAVQFVHEYLRMNDRSTA
jgi:hypothetical protein